MLKCTLSNLQRSGADVPSRESFILTVQAPSLSDVGNAGSVVLLFSSTIVVFCVLDVVYGQLMLVLPLMLFTLRQVSAIPYRLLPVSTNALNWSAEYIVQAFCEAQTLSCIDTMPLSFTFSGEKYWLVVSTRYCMLVSGVFTVLSRYPIAASTITASVAVSTTFADSQQGAFPSPAPGSGMQERWRLQRLWRRLRTYLQVLCR